MAYHVTIRRRGRTERDRFDELGPALDALVAGLDAAAGEERRGFERALVRDVAPVQQVAVRGELRGPRGLRAGIDVRGDGSREAYTGRVTRRLVAQEPGEDAVAALRRVLTAG